ncbi:MAG: winged helix-turn-helix domain-containing protein [Candidatus Korarchaeum sp.]
MDWEVFTLEDERLRLLGQEISSDVGRRILALLKDKPMSPNDLSKELGIPLTTVVFHVEKLRDAGLIRPLVRMAGKRGQKTLYTLSSSAFVILPISNEDKDRIFEALRAAMTIPRELIIRSAIVGLLVGIVMLSPWYFLIVSYHGEQAHKVVYTSLSENASSNATIGPMVKGPRILNETQITETSRFEEISWSLIPLILGLTASTTSAIIGLLMSGKSRRKVMRSDPHSSPLRQPSSG